MRRNNKQKKKKLEVIMVHSVIFHSLELFNNHEFVI